MTFIVTKIEAIDGGYRVTAKDADTTKAKRRNHSAMVSNPRDFYVGQEVEFRMV